MSCLKQSWILSCFENSNSLILQNLNTNVLTFENPHSDLSLTCVSVSAFKFNPRLV